jgi:hypothetical protein
VDPDLVLEGVAARDLLLEVGVEPFVAETARRRADLRAGVPRLAVLSSMSTSLRGGSATAKLA